MPIIITSRGARIPEEGATRCACGSKYWDEDRCHSCGELYVGEVVRPDEVQPGDRLMRELRPGDPDSRLVFYVKRLGPTRTREGEPVALLSALTTEGSWVSLVDGVLTRA